MPSTPTAPHTDDRFTVTVTKPGHDTVRVGPFTDQWAARGFAHILDRGVRGIGAPAGTTLDVTSYDPDQPHRCIPATNPEELARQMDQEPDLPGRLPRPLHPPRGTPRLGRRRPRLARRPRPPGLGHQADGEPLGPTAGITAAPEDPRYLTDRGRSGTAQRASPAKPSRLTLKTCIQGGPHVVS
jgi:hypothetical protein